jgi:hypothetical protein
MVNLELFIAIVKSIRLRRFNKDFDMVALEFDKT